MARELARTFRSRLGSTLAAHECLQRPLPQSNNEGRNGSGGDLACERRVRDVYPGLFTPALLFTWCEVLSIRWLRGNLAWGPWGASFAARGSPGNGPNSGAKAVRNLAFRALGVGPNLVTHTKVAPPAPLCARTQNLSVSSRSRRQAHEESRRWGHGARPNPMLERPFE